VIKNLMKCPGTDTQFWKPNDIFEIKCPACGAIIEFFKDDSKRHCSKCGELFVNPRLELNCFEYCKFGKQCKEYLKTGV